MATVTVDLGNATDETIRTRWADDVDLGATFDADGVGQTLTQTDLYSSGSFAGRVEVQIIGANNRFTAAFEATGRLIYEASDGETLEVTIGNADDSEPYVWIPTNGAQVIAFALHVLGLADTSVTLTLTDEPDAVAAGSTMIRNGVGYAKLIVNGVVSMVGNFNTKSLFAGTPFVPAPPVLADGPRIVAEMKALSQFATIAHFTTRASAGTGRYFMSPANTNTQGAIIEEWVSGVAAHAIFPLVRRLGIPAAIQFHFNQYTGSNVDNGGIDVGSRDWTALLVDDAATPAGIYVVSVDDEEYMCIPPTAQNDLRADRITYLPADIPAETGFHASVTLNEDAEISEWLTTERASTTAREFIIAIAADRTYIPTF